VLVGFDVSAGERGGCHQGGNVASAAGAGNKSSRAKFTPNAPATEPKPNLKPGGLIGELNPGGLGGVLENGFVFGGSDRKGLLGGRDISAQVSPFHLFNPLSIGGRCPPGKPGLFGGVFFPGARKPGGLLLLILMIKV
jgi:hypothetical protein